MYNYFFFVVPLPTLSSGLLRGGRWDGWKEARGGLLRKTEKKKRRREKEKKRGSAEGGLGWRQRQKSWVEGEQIRLQEALQVRSLWTIFFILGIILLDVFVALCVRLYTCAVGSFSVPWIRLEKLIKAFVLSIMRHQRYGLQFGFDSVYVFFH